MEYAPKGQCTFSLLPDHLAALEATGVLEPWEPGRFDGLEGAVPFAEINAFFEADLKKTLQ